MNDGDRVIVKYADPFTHADMHGTFVDYDREFLRVKLDGGSTYERHVRYYKPHQVVPEDAISSLGRLA